MKKIFVLLIATALLLCSVFAACGGNTDTPDTEKTSVKVYAPDGAPALSLAKFINDGENFGLNADFTYNVVAAANIGGVMQQGTGDIVVIPVNAASKLYSVKGYKMAAVVTHGNLYVMAKEDYTLEELKGKVVGVVNLSNVPGLTFKAILKANDIEYTEGDTATEGKVTLKGYSDGSELVPALKQGAVEIGLLPEPAANKLTVIAPAYKYALDLQSLYDAENASYPQAVIMVKTELIEKFPELISLIKAKFDDGAWLKGNVTMAVAAINGVLQEGVTPSMTEENLNAAVIDNCKIFWQDGEAAKTAVINYINGIIGVEPASAKAVNDDFFA